MTDAPGDALGQQVGQIAVDDRVGLAQDERLSDRLDEQHTLRASNNCSSKRAMCRTHRNCDVRPGGYLRNTSQIGVPERAELRTIRRAISILVTGPV